MSRATEGRIAPEVAPAQIGGLHPVSDPIEGRIAAEAARQHGVVARAQLLEAGLSGSAIGRRVRSGWLRPLHRGVYLVRPLDSPRAPQMAAVLAGGSTAMLSHMSAASLAGLRPPPGAANGKPGGPNRRPRRSWADAARPGIYIERGPPATRSWNRGPVDITVVGVNRGRRPGIRVHRVERLDPQEQTVLDGIPTTTPGRTIIDLASVVGTRELETALAVAERQGMVSRKDLCALLARHRGRAGTRALRAILDASGGPALTRSEAEARFLMLVRQAALPGPETNVAVGPYEIDFLWRSAGIAVEVDGFRHHSSRPRFEGDRRKDTWLLAAGIKVIRLSWRQIVQEGLPTVMQVGQAIARATAGHGAR